MFTVCAQLNLCFPLAVCGVRRDSNSNRYSDCQPSLTCSGAVVFQRQWQERGWSPGGLFLDKPLRPLNRTKPSLRVKVSCPFESASQGSELVGKVPSQSVCSGFPETQPQVFRFHFCFVSMVCAALARPPMMYSAPRHIPAACPVSLLFVGILIMYFCSGHRRDQGHLYLSKIF